MTIFFPSTNTLNITYDKSEVAINWLLAQNCKFNVKASNNEDDVMHIIFHNIPVITRDKLIAKFANFPIEVVPQSQADELYFDSGASPAYGHVTPTSPPTHAHFYYSDNWKFYLDKLPPTIQTISFEGDIIR